MWSAVRVRRYWHDTAATRLYLSPGRRSTAGLFGRPLGLSPTAAAICGGRAASPGSRRTDYARGRATV